MLKLIGKFIINAGVLWLASRFLPGVAFGTLQTLLGTAAALAIVNALF